MQNEFNGFSLFNDVEDVTLQAYNRAVVMCNIMDLHGHEMSEDYAKAIESDGEKMMILAMMSYITEVGIEEVKKQINKGEVEFVSPEEAAMMEAEHETIN